MFFKSFFMILMTLWPFMGTSAETSFYDFSANSVTGESVSMSKFKGQVVLVVNTASNCGFTPQFEGLQEIYLKYKDQGFTVIGFPSNDFGGQEPGTNQEISNFCKKEYDVTFPMFEKSIVKGEEKTPLFKFLTEEADPTLASEIRWNFEKLLIGKDGKLVARYSSLTGPRSDKIINQIESLLGKYSKSRK